MTHKRCDEFAHVTVTRGGLILTRYDAGTHIFPFVEMLLCFQNHINNTRVYIAGESMTDQNPSDLTVGFDTHELLISPSTPLTSSDSESWSSHFPSSPTSDATTAASGISPFYEHPDDAAGSLVHIVSPALRLDSSYGQYLPPPPLFSSFDDANTESFEVSRFHAGLLPAYTADASFSDACVPYAPDFEQDSLAISHPDAVVVDSLGYSIGWRQNWFDPAGNVLPRVSNCPLQSLDPNASHFTHPIDAIDSSPQYSSSLVPYQPSFRISGDMSEAQSSTKFETGMSPIYQQYDENIEPHMTRYLGASSLHASRLQWHDADPIINSTAELTHISSPSSLSESQYSHDLDGTGTPNTQQECTESSPASLENYDQQGQSRGEIERCADCGTTSSFMWFRHPETQARLCDVCGHGVLILTGYRRVFTAEREPCSNV
ncbi:hypothetical protein R3P38DRAFT_3120036, partial [Favolaschia claudopus]